MSDRAPTLAEAINRAVELGLRNLHTMIPAKVVKWESDKQRVNCQILIKQVTEDEEGERQVESWPVVTGVPVAYLGVGEFRVIGPATVGTTGMLVFSHRSLDKWLSGSGDEVDPEFDHDHALTDAVFYPGLKSFGSPWQDVPSSGLSIGKDGGLQIAITESLMTLAATAASAEFVVLADKLETSWNTMLTSAIAAAVPNDGGVAALTNLQSSISAAWPNAIAATKVKAE